MERRFKGVRRSSCSCSAQCVVFLVLDNNTAAGRLGIPVAELVAAVMAGWSFPLFPLRNIIAGRLTAGAIWVFDVGELEPEGAKASALAAKRDRTTSTDCQADMTGSFGRQAALLSVPRPPQIYSGLVIVCGTSLKCEYRIRFVGYHFRYPTDPDPLPSNTNTFPRPQRGIQ
eukprot:1320921-Rhodomonas_salina.3